jgi:hypothetical protein
MKMKVLGVLSIVTLLLAAVPGPALAAQIVSSLSTTYTSFLPLVDDSSSQAGAGSGGAIVAAASASLLTAPALSSSSYGPQPGDAQLIRDKVFLDLEKSRLLLSATRPLQVKATLVGSMPDPCHVLRVVVGPATIANVINIDVYSLVKTGSACITVLQPFSVTVSIGTFTSGSYTVDVNGTKLGSFTASPATTTSLSTTP